MFHHYLLPKVGNSICIKHSTTNFFDTKDQDHNNMNTDVYFVCDWSIISQMDVRNSSLPPTILTGDLKPIAFYG